MGWWATLCGLVTGAGSVAGAVKAVADTASKVTDEVHDHNQRVAGADHVNAETNAAAAKVNANVAKVAVTDTDSAALDRLRNGKF